MFRRGDKVSVNFDAVFDHYLPPTLFQDYKAWVKIGEDDFLVPFEHITKTQSRVVAGQVWEKDGERFFIRKGVPSSLLVIPSSPISMTHPTFVEDFDFSDAELLLDVDPEIDW